MKVPRGLDSVYERTYYEGLLKDSEVLDKKEITAPDRETMKRELAFAMLFPVHHESGRRGIWFPTGKAERGHAGDEDIWIQKLVLITVPENLGADYLDFLTHLGYTVMHCCDA